MRQAEIIAHTRRLGPVHHKLRKENRYLVLKPSCDRQTFGLCPVCCGKLKSRILSGPKKTWLTEWVSPRRDMFKRTINRSLGEMEPVLEPDLLAEALRGKIREVILTLTDAGLSEVLAALPYQGNNDRRGYRNGSVDYPAIQSTALQVIAYL